MIQVTRKLIQAGSSPVQYIPPASRGAAIRTKQMTSIVLEIVKDTFDSVKDWKVAVAKAAATFQTYLQDKLVGTQWEHIKVWKARAKARDGKTISMMTIARIPAEKTEDMLKPSGNGVSKVFAREFIDPTLPRDHKFTNLWLQTNKCQKPK